RNDQLTHDAAVPTFSMQPDPALAQVIVDAWLNTDYDWTKPDGTIERVKLRTALLDRDNKGNPSQKAFGVATQKIRQALNVDLKRAVVITEDEHDNDYYLNEDEVSFCLARPGPIRTRAHPGAPREPS
ncbi:MAG: hypothetical protein WBZ16_08445, partial [Pseudolabrys sp.]